MIEEEAKTRDINMRQQVQEQLSQAPNTRPKGKEREKKKYPPNIAEMQKKGLCTTTEYQSIITVHALPGRGTKGLALRHMAPHSSVGKVHGGLDDVVSPPRGRADVVEREGEEDEEGGET